MLLVLVLSVSSVSLVGAVGPGASGAADDTPKSIPHAINPHLDIPKNCQQTIEADDSVLLTCECEACGHPEARDGMNPVHRSCDFRKEGLFCSYGDDNSNTDTDTDAVDTSGRGRVKI
jgi:hypothetical protein